MPEELSSEEAIERARRSIAMLVPGHPAALNREAALRVLSELQRLKQLDRRRAALLEQLRSLLDLDREDR